MNTDMNANKVKNAPTKDPEDPEENINDSGCRCQGLCDSCRNNVKLFEVENCGTTTSLTFNLPPASCSKFLAVVKSLDDPGAIDNLTFFNFECLEETFDLDVDLDELLPNVKEVYITREILSGLNLRSSKVEDLQIGEDEEMRVDQHWIGNKFSFRLPALLKLEIRDVYIKDTSDLARSISSSPKLQKVEIHSIAGMDREPTWYLPSCTDFKLRKSGISRLRLYCPRVERVDVGGSGSLYYITFIKRYVYSIVFLYIKKILIDLLLVFRGKAEHKEYNVKREADMTKFELWMFDVRSKKLRQRMREHPRVESVSYDSSDDEDELHGSDDDTDSEKNECKVN